ncbi:yip1 domain-containing 1 [Calliopsis andreniformis]|uniref:yip1 domain-containing 1 n=1 Tax=Calliopsis andreniformis TaxID=337506 RepID=UPI003FCC770F
MSEYTNQDNYWSKSAEDHYNFDAPGFEQPNLQFEFRSYGDQRPENYQLSQNNYIDGSANAFGADIFNQNDFAKGPGFPEEEEEPPLLEELGIDLDRILQKTLAVLNPFHRKGQIDDANYLLQDCDLAGPVAFCLLLATFLLLTGSKAHFGYIYGLAVTSCMLMYILLSLMSRASDITVSSVASVLGYCLLPIVILAGFGIFATLRSPVGLNFAGLAVTWATLSASRFLSNMSGEENQRILIAYPCALLYGVFTLIVVF